MNFDKEIKKYFDRKLEKIMFVELFKVSLVSPQ